MISLVHSLICVWLFKFSAGIYSYQNYYTIDGQVIHPFDMSVSNHFPRTIAVHIGQARVFPVLFNISYIVADIKYRHKHGISAKIVDRNHNVLFINNKEIEVKLLGIGRTKFIDIPVTLIRQSDTDYMAKFRAWPDLMGMDGEQAVEDIKMETGFSEVLLVTDDTKVSKNLRYDRVLVYVDDDGKVMYVPRTG